MSRAPIPERALRYRVPKEAPQALADVIDSCLDSDPLKRPTGRELVSLLSHIARDDTLTGIGSSEVRRYHNACRAC